MNRIKENWKVLSAFFLLGFVLATLACSLCIFPSSISIFGFDYQLPFPSCSQAQISRCSDYDFEIIEPQGGYIIEDGQVRINGKVKKLPSYGDAWLITIVDSSPVTYWPQSKITVDPTTKTWNGMVYAQGDVQVAVVVIGDDGKILFDYFGRTVDTAEKNNASYSGLVQLTTDIQTCDTAKIDNP